MNEPQLFDPDTTCPTACPVGHCGAIRFPTQQKVTTCAHDLEPDPKRRPRGCLNAHDPEHAEIPF